jgi:hypothetical protein
VADETLQPDVKSGKNVYQWMYVLKVQAKDLTKGLFFDLKILSVLVSVINDLIIVHALVDGDLSQHFFTYISSVFLLLYAIKTRLVEACSNKRHQ